MPPLNAGCEDPLPLCLDALSADLWREIPLTQGRTALVSASDYDTLSQYGWYYHLTGYAVRHESGSRRLIFLHRQTLDPPPGYMVDHINGDRTDNRRENLRLCDPAGNSRNRRPNAGKTYKGISPSGRRWRARIRCNGKNLHLGTFDTPEEAARAYDAAASDLFGEFASLNLPPQ